MIFDIHYECNYNLKLLLAYFAIVCIDKVKSKRTYKNSCKILMFKQKSTILVFVCF